MGPKGARETRETATDSTASAKATMATMAIDQGNTNIKLGIFRGRELVESNRYQTLEPGELADLVSRYGVAATIVSSVGQEGQIPMQALPGCSRGQVLVLGHTTPVPLKIAYATPQTLGVDRIASAVGAATICPHTNLLVVDMGTCITMDLVLKAATADEEPTFVGGNISPGMQMRYKALNHYTQALPLLQQAETTTRNIPLVGRTTTEAMTAGVTSGICREVSGLYKDLQATYPDLRLCLTGGDAATFAPLLTREETTVEVDPDIILIGLNSILQHNV